MNNECTLYYIYIIPFNHIVVVYPRARRPSNFGEKKAGARRQPFRSQAICLPIKFAI